MITNQNLQECPNLCHGFQRPPYLKIMIMIMVTVNVCQLSSGLIVQYGAEDAYHSADDADHAIDDDDDDDHDDDDDDDDDEDYEKAGVSVAKVSSVLHHP